MLGGGPTPAETTLPLALSWPAPPPRAPRSAPRGGRGGREGPGPPGEPGEPGVPTGWRRVGRPGGYPPGQAPNWGLPHETRLLEKNATVKQGFGGTTLAAEDQVATLPVSERPASAPISRT